jgi:hypothetical protein
MNMLLIPAFLQLSTVCKILSLLSSALLAVVVIQTPLMALTSHTGEGGGLGVGVVPPPPDPVLFFLQDCSNIKPRQNTKATFTMRILLIALNCLGTSFKIVVFVFKNN